MNYLSLKNGVFIHLNNKLVTLVNVNLIYNFNTWYNTKLNVRKLLALWQNGAIKALYNINSTSRTSTSGKTWLRVGEGLLEILIWRVSG